MFTRRTLITGAALAGAATFPSLSASQVRSPGDVVVSGQSSDRLLEQMGSYLRDIREEMQRMSQSCTPLACGPVRLIRENMKTYFKQQSKFPDFIDVGIDVWTTVQDWLVSTRQAVNMVRVPDGRLGMTFSMTTLVLRADVSNDFISLGYDTK
jgi:hypothetical protein